MVDPRQVEEWNKTLDKRMADAKRMYAHLLERGEIPVQVRKGAPGGKPGKKFTIKMRTGMGAKGFGVIEPGRKRPVEGYKMLGRDRMLDWLSGLEPQRGTRVGAMDELRKQVFKVAYENPGEVREALLPLLREEGEPMAKPGTDSKKAAQASHKALMAAYDLLTDVKAEIQVLLNPHAGVDDKTKQQAKKVFDSVKKIELAMNTTHTHLGKMIR